MEQDNKGLLNGRFKFTDLSDKSTVVCTYCGKTFKYHHSTSTLQYHLRSKHAFAAEYHVESRVVQTSEETPSSSSRGPVRQAILAEITSKCKPMDQAKYDSITNSLAKWIAMNCRPVNIVTDSGLQVVIRIAAGNKAYTLPSRPTVVSRIDLLFASTKSEVETEIQAAVNIALTIDYWSSVANESYLGVTCHFVNNDWKYRSLVLGVYDTDERYFTENIAKHVGTVIDEWQLSGKVITIGTDNARNMIMLLDNYQFSQCHVLLMHCNSLSKKEWRKEAGLNVPLAKCRKIIVHFKHSQANYDELKVQLAAHGLTVEAPVQDVSTRWNSTFSMLERLLKQKEAVIATLQAKSHNLAMLTDSEWEKLRHLKYVLKPCKQATELLVG